MSDILDRIKALIARTASSSEEEARTSAVIACRLIREHKIELFDPSAPDGGGGGGEPLEDIVSSVWDFLEKTQKRRTAAQASARGYARAVRDIDDANVGRRRYSEPGPRSVYPFDPFNAPFVVVRDFVKTRGIDVHDNGDGSFSAHVGHSWQRGSWPETVRFMFTYIETGSVRR